MVFYDGRLVSNDDGNFVIQAGQNSNMIKPAC